MRLSRRDLLVATGLAAASRALATDATSPENSTPPAAEPANYLRELCAAMKLQWPRNRAIHVVCHGHSVPAGYFKTPVVDTFNAYPHLLHVGIKKRFPFAVVNVIVTAIGGESSPSGARRFQRDVLTHRPDVVTIDYSLNDRGVGLQHAEKAWSAMIDKALQRKIKVILMTPTSDLSQLPKASKAQREPLQQHAEQVRRLAKRHGVGLADSLAAFEAYQAKGGKLRDLLSQSNHPNRKGHNLAAAELLKWFGA